MSGLVGTAALGIVEAAGKSVLTRAKAAGAWLTGLNFWQLACIVVALFAGWQTLGRWSQHRHEVKVEAQLTVTTKALAATRTAFDQTVASYRAAAAKATAADKAKDARVKGEQSTINQETDHEYQARIADARARADRLQQELAAAAAHSSSGTGAPVPGVPPAAGGPTQAACQGGLPAADALTATEQAIQLDELIKWIQRQHAIDVNAPAQGNQQ